MSGMFPWEDDASSEENLSGDAGNAAQPAASEEAGAQVDAFADASGDSVTTDPYDAALAEADSPSADATTADEVALPADDMAPPDARPATVGVQPSAGPVSSRARPVARKEYYSIGEVSDLVGLPAHVLRYWESQFTVLNPSKNRSGNRAYQRKEIRLILLVKQLLYEDKYTVEGAKARLDQLRKGGAIAGAATSALDREIIALLQDDVDALRQVLAGRGA